MVLGGNIALIVAQAIKNLGEHTSQGSSFLIMMILGEAVIPPFLEGWLADVTSIKMSYIITPLCFASLSYYGWWALNNNKGAETESVSTNILFMKKLLLAVIFRCKFLHRQTTPNSLILLLAPVDTDIRFQDRWCRLA